MTERRRVSFDLNTVPHGDDGYVVGNRDEPSLVEGEKVLLHVSDPGDSEEWICEATVKRVAHPYPIAFVEIDLDNQRYVPIEEPS